MNQAELVKFVGVEAGLTIAQAERAIKAIGAAAQTVLGGGGEITLPGIGKLSVFARAARTGRNPSTGEALAIAEKKVPKFSAAKALKDATAG